MYTMFVADFKLKLLFVTYLTLTKIEICSLKPRTLKKKQKKTNPSQTLNKERLGIHTNTRFLFLFQMKKLTKFENTFTSWKEFCKASI